MAQAWQFQEAKAKLSEVIRRAASEGPQLVTHRGVEAAVVLSAAEYRRLLADRPSLADYLLGGAKVSDEVADLLSERSGDLGRDLDL